MNGRNSALLNQRKAIKTKNYENDYSKSTNLLLFLCYNLNYGINNLKNSLN